MYSLIFWWILGLLLITAEVTDNVCVSSSNTLCACFNPSKTTFSIECCGDKIIQLEWSYKEILYELSESTCNRSSSTQCITSNQKRFSLSHEHKVNIHNSCSGKRRCNITVIQSQNIRIQIPVTCESASHLYNTTESLPSTFSSTRTIFYIAGNDYSGKHITYSCTANNTSSLDMTILYINLGPESCNKVKIYLKGGSTFGLGCTDTGITMFYEYIIRFGTEFILEMEDLKLEKNETIYLGLYAFGTNVSCNGNQNEIPGIPSTPSTTDNKGLSTGDTEISKITSSLTTTSDSITDNKECLTGDTENSKMADEEGDEINPHALYGGIIAALIVINIICIGVYCFLRNRKKPKDKTTNVAMSNQTGNENNDNYSHYNHVDLEDAQHTYEQLPETYTNQNNTVCV